MIAGKFSRPNAAVSQPAARKSRYAGIQAAQPRHPIPHAGVYRFRVLGCEEGSNPGKGTESFKAHLEIIEIDGHNPNHNIGDHVVMIQLLTGAAGPFGLARVKAFVMAAAGYADESEFDAFDPQGGFIDAIVGAANEYSARGDTIVGNLVDCQVLRGNPTPDGSDYYRDYAWGVVEQ